MRRILMLVCLFVLSISPVIAQSDETEAWEIVERCISEPVAPPDNWSFDGIIFLESSIGIHGLNSSLETPYILAYQNDASYGSSGAISPDGRWFAFPAGHAAYNNMVSSLYVVETIKTVRTDGRGVISQIEWFSVNNGGGPYIVPNIRWINANEYVYRGDGILQVNPFTHETAPYLGHFDDYGLYSPDDTRLLTYNLDRHRLDVELLHTDTNEVLVNFADQSDKPASRFLSWMPNSEMVAISVDGVLQLYSRDGQLATTITDNYVSTLRWNLNNNEFALISEDKLVLGNLETQQLTDTCLTVTGLGWSPSGKLAVSDGERISIINFEDGTHYIAAYHAGSVFDWRVPPEED
jgi:hypothetical protein